LIIFKNWNTFGYNQESSFFCKCKSLSHLDQKNLYIRIFLWIMMYYNLSPLSGHPLTIHLLSGQNIFPVIRIVRIMGIRLTGNEYTKFIIQTSHCPITRSPVNEDPDNGDWSWVPIYRTVRITGTECILKSFNRCVRHA